MRVTIASLLGLVLFAALALAGLMRPSLLMAQVAATLTLSVLLVATLAAIVGPGRPFWIGMVVFGWGYVLLSQGPWFEVRTRPVLLTTRLLEEAYLRLHEPATIQVVGLSPSDPFEGPAEIHRFGYGYRRFQVIGQWWAAVAHAVAGGFVGRWLAARRRREAGRT